MMAHIRLGDITGLVLAGGRGSRMGGVDKGLQSWRGTPLALNALRRLQQQTGGPLAQVLINANRNLPVYRAWGVPVWPDEVLNQVPDFAGPLAGFATGLAHCRTRYLLTVPCDSPLFALDLAARLADAMAQHQADIAMVAAPETTADGQTRLRSQPVFCLLRTALAASLTDFIQSGGRKIAAWTAQHAVVQVPFDQPGDHPAAFANANTPDELRTLEHDQPPCRAPQ
jgi:molybdenum cofactor guanylyltransferase